MWERVRGKRHAKWYAERGITVCERWRSSAAFMADMGPHPGPDFSLDRIDNDGNYEPGNCRWATRAQQMANQRHGTHSVRLPSGKTLSEIAKASGLKPHLVFVRYQRGWPEKDLGLPAGRRIRTVTTT